MPLNLGDLVEKSLGKLDSCIIVNNFKVSCEIKVQELAI